MHKMRLACNAAAMFFVASFWQTYFSNVQNRSTHYQGRWLAGDLEGSPAPIEKLSPTYANWKIKQDFMEQSNLKDMKYEAEGWKMYSRTENNFTVYDGPFGDEYDD